MTPTLTALPLLLRRLAAEMTTLAADSERLHVLAAVEPAGAPMPDERLAAAQSLDRIVQTQGELAELLLRLADAAPAGSRIATDGPLGAVRLAALKARLAGEAPPDDASGAGDFEFL